VITRGLSHATLALLAVAALAPLAAKTRGAENISTLGQSPDWTVLDKYQETITRDDFARLLQTVYCTRGVAENLILAGQESAQILMNRDAQKWFTLRFAHDAGSALPIKREWRPATALPPAKPGQELAGLKIALDPGHIGGKWAQMEERWFQVGKSKPIEEGEMTLRVAKLLAPVLEKHGAKVSLVRSKLEPVTPRRPDDLREISMQVLLRAGETQPREDFNGAADPEREHTVRWQNELLFYRNSEIRERAKIVNQRLKPDLVLCLHFNAEVWDDPKQPTLTDHNHLHLLVNGAYLPPELEFDDVRFEMLERLLGRMHEEELPLAETLAQSMARRTGLPPYEYTTDNVTKIGTSGYVYARNLMATRLYETPVVYFEPYVMNSNEVFWRVQEGDYEGLRNVNGTYRPSIFREYAAGVVDGLLEYYRAARK
jgi:hypothetical protein